MAKKIDLQGKRFGHLLVVSEAPKHQNEVYWNCHCDCGKDCTVRGRELRRGDTQSCGCLRDKLISADLRNQVFGNLTVIERNYENNPYDGTFWVCKCSCGNIIITAARRLKNGHTSSCGCLYSKGEDKISFILRNAHINFKKQFMFKDCLTEKGNKCKFDFAILEKDTLKYLIEYDGIQHFERSYWNLTKIQKRDQIKNEYCNKNNIPLIRIPYTHLKDLKLDDLLLERTKFLCTMPI